MSRRVESGRGVLGYYIVSNGTPNLYRLKISAGSGNNLCISP
jgi:NADH-quinone oxidoreductase subunit D